MTWEDIWGGVLQAEGIVGAKAMRLECACCVWREKMRGREVGDRADCARPYGLWEDLGFHSEEGGSPQRGLNGVLKHVPSFPQAQR